MGLRDKRQALLTAKAEQADRDANPAQKWEYKALNMAKIPGMAIEMKINELGARGWDYQGMATGGSEGYAIFKRQA